MGEKGMIFTAESVQAILGGTNSPPFVGAYGSDKSYFTRREAYAELWDEINGKRDKGAFKWDNNPWVFVYTFERILNYE